MSIYTTWLRSAHNFRFLEKRLIFGGEVGGRDHSLTKFELEDQINADAEAEAVDEARIEEVKLSECTDVQSDINATLKSYGLKLKPDMEEALGCNLTYDDGGTENISDDFLVKDGSNIAYKVFDKTGNTGVAEKINKEEHSVEQQTTDVEHPMEKLPEFNDIQNLLSGTGAKIAKHNNGMFDINFKGKTLYKNVTLKRDANTQIVYINLEDNLFVSKRALSGYVQDKIRKLSNADVKPTVEVQNSQPTVQEIYDDLGENAQFLPNNKNGTYYIKSWSRGFNASVYFDNITVKKENGILKYSQQVGGKIITFEKSVLVAAINSAIKKDQDKQEVQPLVETENVESTEILPSWSTPKVVKSSSEIMNSTENGTEFFQMEQNKNIYVIDFKTMNEQNNTFNRIVAFVETPNFPKNRVLTNDELSKASIEGLLGHDYKSSDLAKFFTLSKNQKITLNKEEKELLSVLLENGIIIKSNTGYISSSPERALITLLELSEDNLETSQNEEIDKLTRETTLEHELSHGEYFTNVKYANFCKVFWDGFLTRRERNIFKKYLEDSSYDSNNEDLMINEMQAHLIHTDFYKDNLGSVVGLTERRISELRTIFINRAKKEGLDLFKYHVKIKKIERMLSVKKFLNNKEISILKKAGFNIIDNKSIIINRKDYYYTVVRGSEDITDKTKNSPSFYFTKDVTDASVEETSNGFKMVTKFDSNSNSIIITAIKKHNEAKN